MRTSPAGITAVSVTWRVADRPPASVTVSVTVTVPAACTCHGAETALQSTAVLFSVQVSALSGSGSDTLQRSVELNGTPPLAGAAVKSSITGGRLGRWFTVTVAAAFAALRSGSLASTFSAYWAGV